MQASIEATAAAGPTCVTLPRQLDAAVRLAEATLFVVAGRHVRPCNEICVGAWCYIVDI